MPGVYKYQELTHEELAQLPRDRTLVFAVLSPLEVHGPHLPLGTDVMIAQEVMRRVEERLLRERPEVTIVELPTIALGSDPLPLPGSIEISPKHLSGVLYDAAASLARQGFKALILFDNHGGPRHQLAVYKASRKAWKKHRFCLLDPFITLFKMMVKHHPRLMELTGLPPGRCGDDPDMHAGTNETSLMLASHPDKVRPVYRELKHSQIPPHRGSAKLLLRIADLLERLGRKEAASDLVHLANTLAWVNTKPITPYMGAPAGASKEAGETMLQAYVNITLEMVEKVLIGECPRDTPMLGFLAFLA